MNKEAKRRRIVNAIRLVFSSLESHLEYSDRHVEKACETCGTRTFHAAAIKEYAYVIHVLAEGL